MIDVKLSIHAIRLKKKPKKNPGAVDMPQKGRFLNSLGTTRF